MALARTTLVVLFLSVAINIAVCCSPENSHHGCKITTNGCSCAYGCISDYPYRSRRICMDAYSGRKNNICTHSPCVRGTCLQVNQGPGYACRCEGTGFYGQRCEIQCPTSPQRGYVFPLECIVI